MDTTLRKVVYDLTIAGADRGAVVRHGAPGVLVLMTSRAAELRLSPGLLSIAHEMGDAGAHAVAQVTIESRVTDIFEAVDTNAKTGWAWFALPFGKLTVFGAVFVGQPWSDRVAAHCAANGAPCPLDPDKSVPGYITKRQQFGQN